MKKEFQLPELGEDVEEGDVLKVLVKPGDTVEAEQAVLEIETDKATLEVPVDSSGRVEEVKVEEGDHIRVGQVLLVLSTEAETESKEDEDEGSTKEKESSEDDEAAPSERDDEDEQEEEEEEEEEEEAAEGGEPRTEEPRSVDDGETAERKRRPSKKSVPAAPSVRRLARELGIDVAGVEGTGPGGRLSAEDVKAAARAIVRSTGTAPAPKLPDFAKWGALRRERLSGLRRAAARNLARSWSQIPHVTQHDRADITGLDESIRRHAKRVEEAGGKLTLTAIGIHIAAVALARFPAFNASLDIPNDEIVLKEYRHIGVAVDTKRGLVVPVVRNADRLSISETAIAITALAERARAGKLSPDDMDGGSFTVTNLGGIGGTSFTPVVNWPEVAILGLSRSRREPRWTDGRGFEPRLVLPLSLSYDHRAIDGADAARFLRFVAEAFEDPFLLSLEGK